MEKVAFITGITGQDGSYLSEFLLEKGYTVIGLVRRTVASDSAKMVNLEHVRDHQRLILEYGDMSDMASLTRIISHHKPQEVYNLAAQSHVGTSFKTPMSTVEINLNGCLNLLEAIRIIDPKIRFYQASTSEMFGDNIKCPQNENTVLSPVSPYACAKVGAHNLVQTYRKSYSMHASSGILFNHESPRRGENFVTRKITMAAARIKLGLQKELRLGNLEAQRDWGFAGDYVEAMWLMTQQDNPDDYVIATGKSYTVREFLNHVFEYADLGDPDKYIHIDARLFRPHEVPYLLGDPSKAKKKLNWEPKVNFKQLAEMMYDADYNLTKKGK